MFSHVGLIILKGHARAMASGGWLSLLLSLLCSSTSPSVPSCFLSLPSQVSTFGYSLMNILPLGLRVCFPGNTTGDDISSADQKSPLTLFCVLCNFLPHQFSLFFMFLVNILKNRVYKISKSRQHKDSHPSPHFG